MAIMLQYPLTTVIGIKSGSRCMVCHIGHALAKLRHGLIRPACNSGNFGNVGQYGRARN